MPSLKVLSYNIHKGFSGSNLNFILSKIKDSIRETHADILLLQEVIGHHERKKIGDWPTTAQFEYLADEVWPHFAYGKNAVYTTGHHGNAILSKFPISYWDNQDISQNRLERRGLLHAAVTIPEFGEPVHILCAHLGLFESDRKAQINSVAQRINDAVPKTSPLIVGGDFNDWRENISPVFREKLSLLECFLERSGQHAKTFPSWLPLLKLDRIYFRGLDCIAADLKTGGAWKELSDHLPIVAEFSYPLHP